MTHMMSVNSDRGYLKEIIIVPSQEQQKKEIEMISKVLEVNAAKIPLQEPGKITVLDFIKGESIDEPDFGMDQDLPDQADPNQDRAWMGGKTGPTSQGFRHMFFPGFEWMSPLRSIQIPFRSIGQAPPRILKLKEIAQNYFSQKNRYWGLRIALWELHLIQDLHQPFHVTQVPAFDMLPFSSLFQGFVARSTQVIANFHYSYEGLISESLLDGSSSKMESCFQEQPGSPVLVDASTIASVIQMARKNANSIGQALNQLWGEEMKNPKVNLPEGLGIPDYYAYLNASEEDEEQLKESQLVHSLLDSTCGLMGHLTKITWSELDRYLK